MFNIVCVTHRKLCDNFLERVWELYENNVPVILREKDLLESEYEELAKKVIEICPNVILHSYINVAKNLGVKKIHLPLRLMNENAEKEFETVGVSVHSADEAVLAEKMGATYVTAGHIFATDCKKGLEPRGIEFLKNAVSSVDIDVYGIGGISPENIGKIQNTGAKGACIMSGFMKCDNVKKYLDETYKNLLKK